MAEPLARLRIELEADSASLETGLRQAGSAMQRFATVGVAVGNVLSDVFLRMAEAVGSAIMSAFDPTSDLFQKMSGQGQFAASQIADAFNALKEQGVIFGAALADRVLPGIAALVERIRDIPGAGKLAELAFEGLTRVIQGLTAVANFAVTVFQTIVDAAKTAGTAVLQVARGEFREAWDTVRLGAHQAGEAWSETGRVLLDIFNQTQEAANRSVNLLMRPWDVVVRRSNEARNHLRMLREQLMNLMTDPRATIEQQLAAINAALEGNAITGEIAARRIRQAYEILGRNINTVATSIGNALVAVFNKSKPAAIAQALINTYVGITQALASLPPPWSFVQAAAVAAMGFAQVRNITSTSESGGGAGAPSVAAPSATVGQPSQMLAVQGLSGPGLVSMLSMRDLAERLLAFQADGGQVVLQ
jgi:hypothetical protein